MKKQTFRNRKSIYSYGNSTGFTPVSLLMAHFTPTRYGRENKRKDNAYAEKLNNTEEYFKQAIMTEACGSYMRLRDCSINPLLIYPLKN